MNEIIHIGFSKCASTFLQSMFSQSREINYIYKSKRFSLLDEDRKAFQLIDAKINFESDEHILLPSYHPLLKVRGTKLSDVRRILLNIKRNNSTTKVFLVIRNQVALLRSRYSQYIVGGGGTESIDSFICTLNGFETPTLDYYENYYCEIINTCTNILGEDNVLVVLFEDLKSDAAIELNRINEFCGVSFAGGSKSVLSMRKGLSAKASELVRIMNHFVVVEKQDYRGNKRLKLPRTVYTNLIRSIRLVDFFSPGSKLLISEKVRARIENKFKSDNERLQNLLGKDIAMLGYYI